MSDSSPESADAQSWLVLVPTEFERQKIVEYFPGNFPAPVELCGFGSVSSAARTVQLVCKHQPCQVMLLGMAGRYQDSLELGAAYSFSTIGCFGIGCGTGERFQTATQMGWHHWDAAGDNAPIGDTIEITALQTPRMELLTVCAASENDTDVQHRQQKFPNAVAEDMEAFAVALACRLCNVRLSVVRGISNQAGDRNKDRWCIDQSLQSAARLSLEMMEQP